MSSRSARHPFERLYERRNFSENALFLGEVLRIQRAHFRQNVIELRAIVAATQAA
ncbi:hypothetical protein KUV44_13140 [Marinobacter daepoensis]|uniref:Uncharacterized protein n=1 Tax=Marinobacter daepoensis TaxID=262077 RepID=A0ABS3BIV1_9GAMM|nr:hypothetical protein [Marinobacter daepoensis]MBN7771491.1 hypothetical protein [Marinobacter daepoensis]MBY6034239.1 hypothetical protein [Marinobacter daepoensis]MBY6080091.1 hypothetical protein [Marinobacter daepoensis]